MKTDGGSSRPAVRRFLRALAVANLCWCLPLAVIGGVLSLFGAVEMWLIVGPFTGIPGLLVSPVIGIAFAVAATLLLAVPGYFVTWAYLRLPEQRAKPEAG